MSNRRRYGVDCIRLLMVVSVVAAAVAAPRVAAAQIRAFPAVAVDPPDPADAARTTIFTLEHGTWHDAIHALQRDIDSGGRSVHVSVRDVMGVLLRCSEYSLGLDAAVQRAFVRVGCDASTRLTELRLVDRRALFSHVTAIPQPLDLDLTATRTRPSVPVCGAIVTPLARDLEHGRTYDLMPGAYQLVSDDTATQVIAYDNGWVMRRAMGQAEPLRFHVLAARNHAAILTTANVTACGADPLANGASVDARETVEVPPRLAMTSLRGPVEIHRAWSDRGLHAVANVSTAEVVVGAIALAAGYALTLGSAIGGSVGGVEGGVSSLGVGAAFVVTGLITNHWSHDAITRRGNTRTLRDSSSEHQQASGG